MTTTQLQAGLRAAAAVGQAIKEIGSVPEGVLYARLMGHMDLAAFQSLVRLLVQAGVVERDENHVLWYVGKFDERGSGPDRLPPVVSRNGRMVDVG